MRENEYVTPSVLKAHIALNVASVEVSVRFYRQLFGIANVDMDFRGVIAVTRIASAP